MRHKDTVIPHLFGKLVSLTDNLVTSYRSDLFHDAMFLQEYFWKDDVKVIYWSVGDCGTHICHSYASIDEVPHVLVYTQYRHYKITKEPFVYDRYKIEEVFVKDKNAPIAIKAVAS